MSDPITSEDQQSTGQPVDLTNFNLVAAATLLIASLIAIFYLIPEHVPLRNGLDQGLSARFMPQLAAYSTLALSLFLCFEIGFRKYHNHAPLLEDNEDNEQQGFGRRECANALLLSAGLVAYMLLLYLFGFLLATSAILLACIWAEGIRNPVWLFLLGVAFPYLLQQALWHGMHVYMPTGIF